MMTLKAFSDLVGERARQDETWGLQDYDDFVWTAILTEEVGEAAQAALHDRFGGDHAGTLREELIHVAAVAMQWVECIDRRENAEADDDTE